MTEELTFQGFLQKYVWSASDDVSRDEDAALHILERFKTNECHMIGSNFSNKKREVIHKDFWEWLIPSCTVRVHDVSDALHDGIFIDAIGSCIFQIEGGQKSVLYGGLRVVERPYRQNELPGNESASKAKAGRKPKSEWYKVAAEIVNLFYTDGFPKNFPISGHTELINRIMDALDKRGLSGVYDIETIRKCVRDIYNRCSEEE